jgi:hypothetical protein
MGVRGMGGVKGEWQETGWEQHGGIVSLVFGLASQSDFRCH